jgi:hypothetical protein
LKMCPIRAWAGRSGSRSSHWWDAWRIVPSGIRARTPFGVGVRLSTGLFIVR